MLGKGFGTFYSQQVQGFEILMLKKLALSGEILYSFPPVPRSLLPVGRQGSLFPAKVRLVGFFSKS